MNVNDWVDNKHLLSVIDNASAGSTVYPPGGRWGPRIQPNVQFVLVHTGHVHIHVDDEVFFVPAGHVALLHPGHREDFYFAEKSETWHHWVHIELGEANPELLRKLELLPRFIPLSETMNRLTDTLQSLTHSWVQNSQKELRCNDLLAIGAMQAAKQAGVRVPDELSIVGFDDTILATVTDPPLTTVAQPMEHMGKQAFNLLTERLVNQDTVKQRIVLRPELKIRQSTSTLHAKKNEL